MPKLCKICGVELNESNAYGRVTKSGTFAPETKCKICKKSVRPSRATKTERKPARQLGYLLKIVAGRHTYETRFATKEEVVLAKSQRLTQRKYGVCHDGRSSPVGKTCDSLVDVVLSDKSHLRYYKTMQCDECGGLVRIDEHHERACVNCGLVAGGHVFNEPDTARPIKPSHDLMKPGSMFTMPRDGTMNDDGKTYDAVFAAYYCEPQ